jgi:hypothetical protein
MESLQLTSTEIKLKVIKLIQKLEQLENTCNKLQNENLELKNSLNQQKNSIKALEETNKMLKIAEILDQSNKKRELYKVVSVYIKEIDDCLRLLSNK